MKRNKKWIPCSFGDEKVSESTDVLYGDGKEAYDYIPQLISENVSTRFGEIWNLRSCEEAVENCRMFSLRIKL